MEIPIFYQIFRRKKKLTNQLSNEVARANIILMKGWQQKLGGDDELRVLLQIKDGRKGD